MQDPESRRLPSAEELLLLSETEQRELLARLLQQAANQATNQADPLQQPFAAQSTQQPNNDSNSKIVDSFPMSHGQQGLWHAFRRDPSSTAFNVFLPSRIRAPVDLGTLENSITWVANRHPSLRTTFHDDNGQLHQRVHQKLSPEFRIERLAGNTTNAQVQSVVHKAMLRPFDLETGPLLRLEIFPVAADDFVILAATHHIIVDFWSLIVIMQEVQHAYRSLSKEAADAVQDIDARSIERAEFREFVRQQHSLLNSAQGKLHRDYWQSEVGQAAPTIELPLDFVRPPVFTGQAASVSIPFTASLGPRIQSLAARCQSTPFAVLHAAIQILLSRYSRQESFFIGSPFSGRSRQEFDQTVGFFINMLPIRAEVDSTRTFRQIIDQTRQRLIDALAHEAYPISEIVHDSNIARDPSRSPLFQVSFTFEKSQLADEKGRAGFLFPDCKHVFDFAGMRQESFYMPHPTCHYDLEWIMELADDELQGMLVYCKDLFSEDSITGLCQNFVDLLESLLLRPQVPLGEVAWGRQVPEAFNGECKTPSSASSTVPTMILNAADLNPQTIAMEQGGRRVAYNQLIAQAHSLALSLRSSATRGDELLPVIEPPGIAATIAMFASQLAGITPVSIDSTQPSIQLPQLFSDSDATRVLSNQRLDLESTSLDKTPRIIPIAFDQPVTPRSQTDAIQNHATPEQLAYVVYTSGSTGQPKGVMVSHSAICNTLQWRSVEVTLSADDRVAATLTHQFDAGLCITWTTLAQGATLVWPEPHVLRDPRLLLQWLIDQRITVLPAIPSLLRLLSSQPEFRELTDLRMIWAGGEPLPPDLPEAIRKALNVELWNFYGPTEAAVEATAYRATHHAASARMPIGFPITNTEIIIVDQSQRPVPTTVPGEIAIRGAGLAVGYLKQPQETADRFVSTESANVPTNNRMYLTGDLGRQSVDGSIHFLGRLDHQIKLNGYRIELSEIEAVLESHYEVERAAVVLKSPELPQAHLAAFITFRQSVTEAAESEARLLERITAIRKFLARELPRYKVPAAYGWLAEMPLTSSGKVDRGWLENHAVTQTFEEIQKPPQTALEHYIVQIWSDVLEGESANRSSNLGINQDFFQAGGSSLQAALVTHRLSKELQVHVPTALLFDLADIEQIAKTLSEKYPDAIASRFGAESLSAATPTDRFSNDHGDLIADLKPSGSGTPLFLVHPPGGIVACYRELAKCVDPTQPVYGVRSRGLHADEPLPATMQEMATEYVNAIRSKQSTGPYTVGGWSLGGLVAYEVCQQLLARGDTVQRLFLLDTTIPTGSTQLVPPAEQENVGLEYGIDMTLEQLGDLSSEDQLPYLWAHARKLGILQDDTPEEVIQRVLADLQNLFHHHVQLANAYRLDPIRCPLTLIRPLETPFSVKTSIDRGWRFLADDVRVDYVSGHHHSMVQEPHCRELARLLFQTIP